MFFPLLDTVMAEIECAFNPKNPQLSRIDQASNLLIQCLKELSKYSHFLCEYESTIEQQDESKYLDKILSSIDSGMTLGSLLVCISENTQEDVLNDGNAEALAEIKQKLSSVKAAMHRSELGG
jgi:hypothetical protein